MATRYQFVDDSGETRLAGFLVPEPGGSSAVLVTRHVLTDAEFKGLPTVPVEIVATPGAGKFILPVVAMIGTMTGPGNWTNLDGGAALFFQTTDFHDPFKTGADVSSLTTNQAVALGTKDQYNGDENFPATALNAALELRMDNAALGNLTGGDASNAIPVSVVYAVIDTAT